MTMAPLTASAGIFSFLSPSVEAGTGPALPSGTVLNSQKIPLLGQGMGPVAVVSSDSAAADAAIGSKEIAPSMGPLGSAADVVDLPPTDQVTVYTVHQGDTIASVAKMFGVTKATIIAANDLTANQALKADQVLNILPISGLQYTVKKGDTLKSIAKKFKNDAGDIAFYNDLAPDSTLSVGDTLLIPDPDFDITPTPSKTGSSSSGGAVKVDLTRSNPIGDLIARPIRAIDGGGIRTQGFHGYKVNGVPSGVDIGTPIGTPLVAGYDGVITIAKDIGYNGGYGSYIVLDSTIQGVPVRMIYGHLSKLLVTPGQTVSRGQVIGLSGSSGHSTGPHVHWEVRGKGVINPVGLNRNFGL